MAPTPLSSEKFAEVACSHDAGDIAMGIDFSTDRTATALAVIAWPAEGLRRLVGLWRPCDHEAVAEVLSGSRYAVAAVDVPFGWPVSFFDMLTEHQKGPLQHDLVPGSKPAETWRVDEVALRHTDRFIYQRYGRRPIAVGFEKLGATAASWALIEPWVFDAAEYRDGSQRGNLGRVVETYPTAQVLAWGQQGVLDPNGSDHPARSVPTVIRLARTFSIDLGHHREVLESSRAVCDHARDAFVCALTAALILREPEACHPMVSDQVANAAAVEGVIWLNDQRPSISLPQPQVAAPTLPTGHG